MVNRHGGLARAMAIALAEQWPRRQDKEVARLAVEELRRMGSKDEVLSRPDPEKTLAGWLGAVKQGTIKNDPNFERLLAFARVLGKDVTFFTSVLDQPVVPILPQHPMALAQLKAAIAARRDWPQTTRDEMIRMADEADRQQRRSA